MAGLDENGLVIKRAADVRADLQAAAKSASGFGPGASVREEGPLGKLIGIISEPIALVWQALQAVYDAFDPDQATGEALDNLAALTGVVRLSATKTSGTVTLGTTGGAPVLVPLGSVVRIADGAQFETLDAVTIPAGGTIDVSVKALESGPIEATAGSIDTIVTVTSGWDSVTNADDLITGRNAEKDYELRIRREESLQVVGGSTVGAIRAQLLQVAGVLAVNAAENTSLSTDANGLPGKAFEMVVHPNTVDPALIAIALFNSKPAGVLAYGSQTATVTDEEGFSQVVGWTWANIADIYVDITPVKTALYPVDGDTLIAEALADFSDTLELGSDVLITELLCIAFDAVKVDGKAGMTSASILIKVGSMPGISDNVDLEFTYRDLPRIQASNVEVN